MSPMTKQQLIAEAAKLRQRVTELETAKAELTTSRAILQATIENLPFDFWAIGLDGRYMIQNFASKKHWGDAVGKRPEDVAEDEQNRSVWLSNNRRAFAGEKVDEEVELTVQGETRTYHNVIAPILVDGDIQGILGMNSDMTERKRAEKTLRLSEANYRAIFDTANDTIFVHDADSGAILDANQKATEMYGYTTEEFRRINVEVLSEGQPPYSQAEAMQWIGRASTGSPQLFVWKAKDKGGRIFWVEVNLKRTTLNGVPRLLAIVRDITDRKRAELALRESEERYRTIFEEGPLGIVLASLDLEVQYVNQRFCEMLGYSEMEIIALGIAGISHPDDRDADHRLGSRLRRGKLPYYTIDKRYIRKDGTAFWGQLTVSMMHDAEGKPTAMIRMIQDITEHKEIAELLQESEAKYRRLHESMRDAFVSVDMDGFIREYNEAYRKCSDTNQKNF